ncbi:MAG: SRPBCC family protein [Halopseudomonas sp.]|uniref:SRPBCC family protein n=1 Tax=Halopseudomonas sp. TaxID=2901191 RepID=UPI003001CA1C
MFEATHISLFIARRPTEVYAFASNPLNLPRWATGLATAEIRWQRDAWIAQAPFGAVKITFAEPNAFGVMDHDVELESGQTFHNPMRVIANGAGSEFIFTLLRQPEMSDDQFATDKLAIETDLKRLKELLEAPH